MAPYPEAPDRSSATSGNRVQSGWALALTSTLSFSIAPTVSRGAILAGMSPATLLLLRMAVAALLLGGSIGLASPGRLKPHRRVSLNAIFVGMVHGLGFLSFLKALTRLEASVGSMIFALGPLVVLVLLAFRGEKLTRRHLYRLALGLGGAYLLLGPSGQVDRGGAILALIGVLTYSLHLVLIQWFLRDQDARTVTFYIVVGIMITAAAGWLIEREPWTDPGRSGWLAILALAVVSTFLARLSLYGAVQRLGSGQIALLAPLDALLPVLWSMIFLHERLSAWQWVGSGAILASVLLAVDRLRRIRPRPRWRMWSRL